MAVDSKYIHAWLDGKTFVTTKGVFSWLQEHHATPIIGDVLYPRLWDKTDFDGYVIIHQLGGNTWGPRNAHYVRVLDDRDILFYDCLTSSIGQSKRL